MINDTKNNPLQSCSIVKLDISLLNILGYL